MSLLDETVYETRELETKQAKLGELLGQKDKTKSCDFFFD